jgi:competence protein ComEA
MSDWLERNRLPVFLIVLNIATVGALLFWFRKPTPSTLMVQSPTATIIRATPAVVRVHVCGEVAYTDVYTLAQGAIVKDALMAAGGPTGQADLTQLNLAQMVQDGDQICVPTAGKEAAAQAPAISGRAPVIRININKASYEEIQALPGIGPSYARAIVEYRKANGPFQNIEELEKVKGIGPATIEKLRDLITLR